MATEVSRSEEEKLPCALHSKESVELYCKDHGLVVCKICKVLKHKQCDVENITVAFRNVDVSEMLNEVSAQIMTLGKAVQTSKTEMQSLLDQSAKEKTDIEEKLETVRKGLNGVLDRYKDQLSSQLMSETDALTVTMQAYESLSDQLENQKATLENAKGNGLQEIVALIEATNLYKEYQHVTEEMDNETQQVKIRIREDEMLPDLLQQLTSIGQREIADSEEITDGIGDKQQQEKIFLDIKSCTAVQESDIKLPIDEKIPTITGCCFSPDGGVIICDHDNKKVKILDKEMKIKFTIPCPESPSDVARFDENSAVVLYASDNSFQFVCVKPGIMLQQKKATKLSCYGLESLNKIVYISCYDSERNSRGVAGFVKDGWIATFVPFIATEIQSLGSYLSLSNDSTNIYYVGHSSNACFINKLSTSGHGIYSVCTTSLKKPKSIVCDSAGNLVVCDTGTKGVHIIESDGKVGNTLITETDDFAPTSVCLNTSRDTLIVASSQKQSSRIIVYRLNYN